MLRRLTVKNLAIVEDLELELDRGLTVVTGETGAGKSILVDALALVAGGRGSADLIRQGAARLTVSAEFDAGPAVRALLAEAGLPDGERLLLRRELTPDGRGRAFVEDEPAAVRTLARLGERLVAIHGQSSEQELTDAGAALELLDAFAKTEDEREAVATAAAALDRGAGPARGPRGLAAAARGAPGDARLPGARHRVRRTDGSRGGRTCPPSAAGCSTPTGSGARARPP